MAGRLIVALGLAFDKKSRVAILTFKDALEAHYGPLDWVPVPDGQIHWFHIPGDPPGYDSGWYFFDGANGCWGSLHPGGSGVWHSSSHCLGKD